jgi:hypothetical protein
MLKTGPLVAAICLVACLQACSIKPIKQCTGDGGCTVAGGDNIACPRAPSCMSATPNSSTGVGVVSGLPSTECNLLGGQLVIPSPYFTTRTPDFSNPTIPHQCQAFNVVWNECNSGTTMSAQTSYQVSFVDDAPPGNDHGIMTTAGYSVAPLAPCACHSENQTFTLYCNDPTFTATTTHITATLPTETGFPNATGGFMTDTP